MRSQAFVAVFLVAFLAVLHGGQCLKCHNCRTHGPGTAPTPAPNTTSDDNSRATVEINDDDTWCRSQEEAGGTIKGAITEVCNMTIHNTCARVHTYSTSSDGKVGDIWTRRCSHVEEDDQDSCWFDDGYTVKSQFCYCSTDHCNGAETRSVAVLPLAASLIMGVFYAVRH